MSKPIRKSVRVFIFDGENVLTIKYKNGVLTDYYDIPGGKIEDGESNVDTAIRECKEELNVEIVNPKYKGNLVVEEEDKIFDFDVFVCNHFKGVLKDTPQNDVSWMRIEDLLRIEKRLPCTELLTQSHIRTLLSGDFSMLFWIGENSKIVKETGSKKTQTDGPYIHPLKNYLTTTVLVERSPRLKLRMTTEHLEKYRSGKYEEFLNSIGKAIEEIDTLGIEYPASAKPVYYIYVVPDENFRELLDYPASIDATGGGKPVICYDTDGFTCALGMSSNAIEWRRETSLYDYLNDIHELAHLSQAMFCMTDQFWCEGLAESIVFYALSYDKKAKVYTESISKLEKSSLMSAETLIDLGKNDGFHSPRLEPHLSCSFEVPYVSSYLLVRLCLERISTLYRVDRKGSIRKFLEILYQNLYQREYLVFSLADTLGFSREELLSKTDLQYEMLQRILGENGLECQQKDNSSKRI